MILRGFFDIQKENKKKFPYLSGTKICNYWLYVIYQYTDRKYKNINQLTVAPDTHVIQATHKLGLITDEELNRSDVQLIVVERWNELFKGTKYNPIDIHTPLWLWSRNGFKEVINVEYVTYGELKKIGFKRTKTLGYDGDCCDFHFYKK